MRITYACRDSRLYAINSRIMRGANEAAASFDHGCDIIERVASISATFSSRERIGNLSNYVNLLVRALASVWRVFNFFCNRVAALTKAIRWKLASLRGNWLAPCACGCQSGNDSHLSMNPSLRARRCAFRFRHLHSLNRLAACPYSTRERI